MVNYLVIKSHIWTKHLIVCYLFLNGGSPIQQLNIYNIIYALFEKPNNMFDKQFMFKTRTLAILVTRHKHVRIFNFFLFIFYTLHF